MHCAVAIIGGSSHFMPEQRGNTGIMGQTSKTATKTPAPDKKADARAGELRPDLCVIGTDPAGVELAFSAAGLGAGVVLVTLDDGNLTPEMLRLRSLGGQILTEAGDFVDARRFSAGNRTIRARIFVLATGAEPMQPAIEGVAGVTSAAEGALLVIGGGHEVAMRAQRERAGGAEVTVLSDTAFLSGFDPEAANLIRVRLQRAGVTILDVVAFDACSVTPSENRFELATPGLAPFRFDRLALCGPGMPKLAGLGLEKAGVPLAHGVLALDAAGKTRNNRIFALGAVAGPDLAQHKASAIASILGQVFAGRAKAPAPELLTRLCPTTPAIAEVGLAERAIAASKRANYRFYRAPLPDGHIKAVTTAKGLLCGVSIVSERAAELVVPFVQTIAEGKPLQALASLPIASPGPADAIAMVARLALRERLRASWWLKLLRVLGLTRLGSR